MDSHICEVAVNDIQSEILDRRRKKFMGNRYFIIALLTGLLWIVGCSAEPEIIEVTRVVNQELPVTVEVTRLVPQIAEVTREVPFEVTVEVTREVAVTPTPVISETATTAPSPTPPPTATPPPSATPPGLLATYTVQPGDTLASISALTGVSASVIQQANNLSDPNQLTAGQTLVIPGWDGVLTTGGVQPTAPAAATQPPPTVGQGANLLPNPSFEGDWYFYLYNELQIPEGWQLNIDEGPNTLDPGPGGTFFRPEVRVITRNDLPPQEQEMFVFEGNKTVKAFKGGAPTIFWLFTDVPLPAGSYRFTINFFTDTVLAYENGQKVFASDPLAAEVRVIFNEGGTDWQGTISGQRNSMSYDFTLTSPQTVRLGGGFRNRFVMANNSWFIDDWSLYQLP